MFGKRENVFCPVCNIAEGKLGVRYPQDYFDGHCDDCRATYYFKPNSPRPYKVLTDKTKRNRCYCSNCADQYL